MPNSANSSSNPATRHSQPIRRVITRFRRAGYRHCRFNLDRAHELVTLPPVITIDETLIESATQTLVSEFHPEQIWLFGSHAWGTPTSDSDLDLMVVVRDSDEPAIRRSQRALRCLQGLPMPKDVIVPTRAQVDRYKHLRASLFHQILTRGRKLYG